MCQGLVIHLNNNRCFINLIQHTIICWSPRTVYIFKWDEFIFIYITCNSNLTEYMTRQVDSGKNIREYSQEINDFMIYIS